MRLRSSESRVFAAVAVGATLAVVAFGLRAPPGSNYNMAPFFLVPLVWGVYLLRRKLHLHPAHFVLFAVCVLMHNLGAFGYYQRRFGGLPYDAYVHFTFGLLGGLVAQRLLSGTIALRPWSERTLTVLVVLGFGALHELMEWGSTLVLGEKGMVKPEAAANFDTQRDMFSNLVGAAVALALRAAVVRARRSTSTLETPASFARDSTGSDR